MSSLLLISSLQRLLVLLVFAGFALTSATVRAQNTPHEVGVWFASQGQVPLNPPSETNHGFFQNPTIGHVYYSFVSNGVQNLSVFLDHAEETRTRNGLWSDIFLGGESSPYKAEIAEKLQITTLGIETMRTLISESDLRVAIGLGVSYGLGRAYANVRNLETNQSSDKESCTQWNGLMLSGMLRLRYTVYTAPTYELALMAAGRYWGFPYIGPIGDCADDYNGPDLRTLNEFGYLAGLSVGF